MKGGRFIKIHKEPQMAWVEFRVKFEDTDDALNLYDTLECLGILMHASVGVKEWGLKVMDDLEMPVSVEILRRKTRGR